MGSTLATTICPSAWSKRSIRIELPQQILAHVKFLGELFLRTFVGQALQLGLFSKSLGMRSLNGPATSLCEIMYAASCSIGTTFTPYGLTGTPISPQLGCSASGADNECAPDCQESLDGKNASTWSTSPTQYVTGVVGKED